MRQLAAAAAFLATLVLSSMGAQGQELAARIDISSQTMVVTLHGDVLYTWKVSTARKGYVTPLGRFKPLWLSRYHRSQQYDDAPMPYAIFFHRGYAIHGTTEIRQLGQPASHGCVRIHPDNAATLFSLVQREGLAETVIVVRQ
jgi:lipoprotein-anchoring transpeptidase ErfK/SrfK